MELTIVVLGVAIGFQVNNWGQYRGDRDREQAYLHQLAADLRETESRMLWVLEQNRKGGEDLVKFILAYQQDNPPPTDSLLLWGWNNRAVLREYPVLGTAESLVASGDIRLIQDNSIRSAVTGYLDSMRLHNDMSGSVGQAYLDKYEVFLRRFDRGMAAGVALSPEEISQKIREDYLWVDIPSEGSRPYPLPDNMLQDLELHSALRNLWDTRIDLRFGHQEILERSIELAEMVEAGITD